MIVPHDADRIDPDHLRVLAQSAVLAVDFMNTIEQRQPAERNEYLLGVYTAEDLYRCSVHYPVEGYTKTAQSNTLRLFLDRYRERDVQSMFFAYKRKKSSIINIISFYKNEGTYFELSRASVVIRASSIDITDRDLYQTTLAREDTANEAFGPFVEIARRLFSTATPQPRMECTQELFNTAANALFAAPSIAIRDGKIVLRS